MRDPSSLTDQVYLENKANPYANPNPNYRPPFPVSILFIPTFFLRKKTAWKISVNHGTSLIICLAERETPNAQLRQRIYKPRASNLAAACGGVESFPFPVPWDQASACCIPSRPTSDFRVFGLCWFARRR